VKKRRNKVINLIFALIVGNLLLFILAKQSYNLADGLQVGTPDYQAAKDLMYFWFDFSNHLRYVLYNAVIIALLFLVTVPIYLRVLMIIYCCITIKNSLFFVINGNTGTFSTDIIIFIIGVLWLLKKAVNDWHYKSCVIIEIDDNAIYRVTTRSKTFLGTILSIFGRDIESAQYYAYDTLYKFTKRTSRYIAIECEGNCVTGNIERIPCDSKEFARCLNEKVGSKYNAFYNNCENVTNEAKAKVGLKKRIFPQIN